MKIRPVGTDLFYAERRTDMTKLIVAFCNFANAPNKTKWNKCRLSNYVLCLSVRWCFPSPCSTDRFSSFI